MKISAIPVTSSDLKKTVKFYETLGFEFPEFKEDEDHLEPITKKGDVRLMIDTKKLITEMLGFEPKPSNHSTMAIEVESSKQVDELVAKIKAYGFKVYKEPWDAFWGQRYAIVSDPDGYLIDIFAYL